MFILRGDLEWKGACTDGVSTVWGSWKVRYRPDIENLIKYAVLFVKVDHSGLILMGMTWSGKVHDMMLFQMSGVYGKAKYRDDLKNVVLFYRTVHSDVVGVTWSVKVHALMVILNKRAMMALVRSPEYHCNQIISKSLHRFSRRSPLKLFSIHSPGGHFVQQTGTV